MIELESAILAHLSQKTDESIAIEPDEDLFASGVLDSLGLAELITFLEGYCSISIPMGDIVVENFATVLSMAEYIEEKKSAE